MIINILIFILVLAVVVIVHELGHFFAAKKSGMFVGEFGFGFPPRIWGKRKGETLWSINAIPLGGFVKIAGEDGEKEDVDYIPTSKVVSQEESVEVVETPTEELIIEEKITKVDKFSEISSDRFFSSKPIWKRIIVLVSGVLMNFILGWIILVVVFSFGTQPIVVISQVMNNSPAETVGIKEGDKIMGFSSVDDFIQKINESKGKEISLTIKRSQDTQIISVVPRLNPPEGEGALGVGLSAGGVEKMPFFQAVIEASKTAVSIFGMIYSMLFKLIASIFGGPNLFKYISGPVGIFQATSQAAGFGVGYLANLIALISINLAAINIFPFPALDGGRILFLIIEKIKGSPISSKIQQIVNGVGFALLLVLILAASVQDIIRLF